MKWRTQNICIGVLVKVDTACGDVSLFALASDVSERSTECIFTMKEDGTFTLRFVSCASAQFLTGRRVGLSGRGITALNICWWNTLAKFNELPLRFLRNLNVPSLQQSDAHVHHDVISSLYVCAPKINRRARDILYHSDFMCESVIYIYLLRGMTQYVR